MGPGWLSQVTLNLDVCLPAANLGNLVSGLHPKKRVHLRAESFLDPQCHVWRGRGAGVERGRESGPAPAKNLCRLGNGETERLDHFHPDELSRVGRAYRSGERRVGKECRSR